LVSLANSPEFEHQLYFEAQKVYMFRSLGADIDRPFNLNYLSTPLFFPSPFSFPPRISPIGAQKRSRYCPTNTTRLNQLVVIKCFPPLSLLFYLFDSPSPLSHECHQSPYPLIFLSAPLPLLRPTISDHFIMGICDPN